MTPMDHTAENDAPEPPDPYAQLHAAVLTMRDELARPFARIVRWLARVIPPDKG